MMNMKISRCRKCNAEIHWATTQKGRFMPVNAKKVTAEKDGMLLVDINGNVFKASAGQQGYESHFASCPYSEEFRRKKEAEKLKERATQEDRRYGE